MRLTDLFLALPVLPLLLVIIMLFREPLSQQLRNRGRDIHPDGDGDRHHLVDARRPDRAR
jgi:ABC-type dipeptide/oligopeptide/nickel transport system permease subunit